MIRAIFISCFIIGLIVFGVIYYAIHQICKDDEEWEKFLDE